MKGIGEAAQDKNQMAFGFEAWHQARSDDRAFAHPRTTVKDERPARENLRAYHGGFLLAPEIYNLKLPATDLVVLSACQTGLGKEVRGEGVVGLTRGFMYAGAPRVVVSLWNVSDRATADLMKSFYQGMLAKGLRPAAALRSAQIEMLKQRQWRAPYYWAAFGLQGEWR